MTAVTNNTGLARFNAVIQSPKTAEYLNTVLGENAKAFTTSLVSLVANNSLLQNCEPVSVMYAAMKAATLNLPLDSNLGFAYVIPYTNKGKTEAQFQMGYKGLIQLCIRSGQFSRINVTDIREGEIKRNDLLTGDLVIEPAENRDELPIVGYCGYFRLVNGFEKSAYWTIKQLQEHGARYSQTAKRGYGLWVEQFDAMAKKGLAVDTPIPTPDGFKTMGELQVGDVIYNALGEETRVIAKSEVKHKPCYEIEFQNGDTVTCDEEHRWFVKSSHLPKKQGWTVMETKDMYGAKALGCPMVIPQTKPVKMQEKELLIDPYVLGYWLGNGSHKAAVIACHEDDADEISAIYEKFYDVSLRHDKRSHAVALSMKSKTGLRSDNSSLKQQIKMVGVYGNKHIPMCYKRASIEQRVELVRGLCDSDGSIDLSRGRVKYGSVKQGLVDDMYEVLCSLGERVHMRSMIARGYGTTTTYYEVEWQPRNFNPFHLKRKAERVKERLITPGTSIKDIRKVESVPTQCIAVESGDVPDDDLRKSYLFGYGFNTTHNTVLKLLLSKYAPMSLDMQQAIVSDQAVFREPDVPTYVDNQSAKVSIAELAEEEVVATTTEVTETPKEEKK